MARTFIRMRFPTPPSTRRTQESIDKFMGRALRFAVREALQAHINDIHVLSGMARGTFLHISKFVSAGINFPSNPGFTYYHRKGDGGRAKSAALGASFSTARSTLDAQKRFSLNFPRYTFEMQTALRYFNIEDKVRWNFSKPFQKTLERKLREYIAKNGPDLIGDIFATTTRGRGIR